MQSHFFCLYFLSTLKMEIMSQELKTIDFPTDFGSLNGMERKTKRKKTAVSYTHLTLPTICSV